MILRIAGTMLRMVEPPPRVPPDPDDETIIVPPAEETVVADAWEPESEVIVEQRVTEPPPRRPVIWPWLLALLVLVLGGLGAYLLLTRDDDDSPPATTSAVTTATQDVRVPDVVGTTSSEATAALTAAGLDANLVAVPSDRSPGTVIAQNPPAGDEVAEGSSVRLNVAEEAEAPAATTTEPTTTTDPTTTAPEPASVPDVAGQELADAARAFGDEGLKVAVQYVPSNEAPGRVVAQAQPPGTERRQGDTVQVNVSLGSEPAVVTAVPDVTGQPADDARETLENARLEVLAIELDGLEEGVVDSQTPSARARVPRGSLVILYVGD